MDSRRASAGSGQHGTAARRALRPALAALAMIVALSGCLQATTEGGDAPDTVTISGTPTWSNGVGHLMAVKCAVCHQQPRPTIAPNTIPTDMDLRLQTLSGTTRGGEAIAAYIGAGILSHAVLTDRQMPLDYATPLVASEIAALETWAANVTPPVVSGTTAADGAILYTFSCQGCHGIGGNGGKYTSVFFADVATIKQALACNTSPSSCSQTMYTWPGLINLTDAQLQAISAYLQQ
jgi:mono/diheme cytochrome c family protein